MINGDQSEIGCVKTGLNQIILPNGLSLQYPHLQSRDGEFYYLSDPRNCAAYERGEDVPTSKWTKIYGGKIVENVVQALATIAMKEYMVKVGRKYPLAFQVHDEIVLCVPESKADAIQADVEAIMSKPPKWCADLPVACEAGWAKNYGDVER
jgi:DNA polymerase